MFACCGLCDRDVTQRYTDLYDHTVALAKRVMMLEDIRSGKNEELHFLRNKVATQSRIIDTMSDNVVSWRVFASIYWVSSFHDCMHALMSTFLTTLREVSC